MVERNNFCAHVGLSLILIMFSACGSQPGTNVPIAESLQKYPIVEGEYRVEEQQAFFYLCGSARTYNVSGSAAVQLKKSYHDLASRPKEVMKVWLEGHLVEGESDTVFNVASVKHIVATLRCAGLPNDALGGTYTAKMITIPGNDRTYVLTLLPSGVAKLHSIMEAQNDTVFEKGTWNMNTDSVVNITWARRGQTVQYQYKIGAMTSIRSAKSKGQQFEFTYAGPIQEKGAEENPE